MLSKMFTTSQMSKDESSFWVRKEIYLFGLVEVFVFSFVILFVLPGDELVVESSFYIAYIERSVEVLWVSLFELKEQISVLSIFVVHFDENIDEFCFMLQTENTVSLISV
jgi:hypothetical protein